MYAIVANMARDASTNRIIAVFSQEEFEFPVVKIIVPSYERSLPVGLLGFC